MITFKLNKLDVEGIYVLIKNEKVILIDRYGLRLFNKYMGKNGWRTNFSIPHLHRMECIGKDSNGKLKYRAILFYRELLGVNHYDNVIFWNKDILDLRLINLYVRGLEQNESYSIHRFGML